MAITVEDGTGKADAQSYLSVADANSYFSTRGVTAWAGVDSVKEAALIAATEYIDIRWGKLLKGELEFPDVQALLFPRTGIYDEQGRLMDGVPVRLKRATAEYAVIHLSQTLMPNPTIEDNGKTLTSSTETVGPITEAKQYTQGFMKVKPYPKADALMECFITGNGNGGVYV